MNNRNASSLGFGVLAAIGLLAVLTPPATAQNRQAASNVIEAADGRVIADGLIFDSWQAYFQSDFFRIRGMRCGAVASFVEAAGPRGGSPADCTYNYTNPAAVFDPSVVKYRIPVVVHVIRNSSGTTGNISTSMVQSQIDILNEDYLALPGTNGQNGLDVQIEFYLATTDPGGSPTNGITYSNNTTWFNDGGGYYNSLAWDTNRYMNIYTNTAGGYLGYVPDLPQGGIAGSNSDRVVIHYQSFGRNSPGYPYHMGRTATHEIGHYLGLYHPFDNGCGTSSCYTTGDRICDTNKQSNPNFGCSNGASCGTSDDYRNYMDYTDDLCMTHFTFEQARRSRCSLEHYRPNLYEIVPACPGSATGDVNGDSNVDGRDIDAFVTAILGTPTQGEICEGDFNGSNDLDAGDVAGLVSVLVP